MLDKHDKQVIETHTERVMAAYKLFGQYWEMVSDIFDKPEDVTKALVAEHMADK